MVAGSIRSFFFFLTSDPIETLRYRVTGQPDPEPKTRTQRDGEGNENHANDCHRSVSVEFQLVPAFVRAFCQEAFSEVAAKSFPLSFRGKRLSSFEHSSAGSSFSAPFR